MRLFPFSLFCFPCLTAAAAAAGFSYTLPDMNGSVLAIAVDGAGNTYLTGSTTSAKFPTTPGAVQPAYGGGDCNFIVPFGFALQACTDAFVVKLNPAGAVVWVTYLGGVYNDLGTGIAVDGAGNVFVAGTTYPGQDEGEKNNFPTTSGAAFPNTPAQSNAFLVKLSPDGSNMLYSTYLPGLGAFYDVAGLAVDSSGNAYVAGAAAPVSSPVPTTPGAFQSSSSASMTAAVVKVNPAGSAVVYATYVGGTAAQDYTFTGAIAVDASGSAYITGYFPLGSTSAADFPVTPGAYQTASSGEPAFVTKLSPDGSTLIYSTFIGGANGQADAIKVDSQGRAYILGASVGFPTTAGAFEPSITLPPAWDPDPYASQFLASLSADGSTLVYGTYLSGATALEVDPSGDAYLAGNARLSGFPVSAGAFQACFYDNPYAAEFSPQGALLGATYFGQVYTEALPWLNTATTLQMNGPIALAPNGTVTIGTIGNGFDGLQGAFVYNFPIDNPQQPSGPCVSPIVQNAAYYYEGGTSVSPGEVITLQGFGIGPETGVSGVAGANGLLPTNLEGVEVLFGNIAAPLLYAQAGQINLQVPWELARQTSIQVQVMYQGTPMNSFGLSVEQAVPGLSYLSYPSMQGGILNANGSVNSAAHPANPGDVIALFGTGAGPTNPPGVTGGFWSMNANTLLTLPVTVQIGAMNAPVIYAGAAPGLLSGYFQIDVQVPAGLAANPAAPVSVYLGLAKTYEQVTVAVQ